jgi:hypothetical protein
MMHPTYSEAAKLLGWRFSTVHDGLINENKKVPVDQPQHEGGYVVAFDSEDACFLSGVESLEEAEKLVEESKT